MKKFDLIIIGSGAEAEYLVERLRHKHQKIMIVEPYEGYDSQQLLSRIFSETMSKDSKAYLTASSLLQNNEYLKDFSKRLLSSSYQKTIEKCRAITNTKTAFENVFFTTGTVEFKTRETLQIGGIDYGFKNVVIINHKKFNIPFVEGLNQSDVITSQNLHTLTDMPQRLLLLGDEPSGLPIAQNLARLGCRVTIVTTNEFFCSYLNQNISKKLNDILKDDEVTVLTQAELLKIENRQAIFDTGSGAGPAITRIVRVAYDKLLINTSENSPLPKGLKHIHVEVDKNGLILTNKHGQSSVSNVYFIRHNESFYEQSDQIIKHLLRPRFISFLPLPPYQKLKAVTIINTDPPVGSFGATEDSVENLYNKDTTRSVTLKYGENINDESINTGGIAHIIFAKVYGTILGGHFIGRNAQEVSALISLSTNKNYLTDPFVENTTNSVSIVNDLLQKINEEKKGHYFKDLATGLKSHRLLIFILLVWSFLLVWLWGFFASLDITITEAGIAIFTFVSQSTWGPLLYILTYTIRPLTFIPASILSVLSGVFFGFWFGIIYTTLGALFSENVSYWIGRILRNQGRKNKKISEISSWKGPLLKHPFLSVLLMRFSLLPYDAVSYISGLLKIPWPPYALASFIGTIPGITIFVSFGASIDLETFLRDGFSLNILNPVYLTLSGIIFAISVAVTKLLRRMEEKNTTV